MQADYCCVHRKKIQLFRNSRKISICSAIVIPSPDYVVFSISSMPPSLISEQIEWEHIVLNKKKSKFPKDMQKISPTKKQKKNATDNTGIWEKNRLLPFLLIRF